jgi:hypothetical protein
MAMRASVIYPRLASRQWALAFCKFSVRLLHRHTVHNIFRAPLLQWLCRFPGSLSGSCIAICSTKRTHPKPSSRKWAKAFSRRCLELLHCHLQLIDISKPYVLSTCMITPCTQARVFPSSSHGLVCVSFLAYIRDSCMKYTFMGNKAQGLASDSVEHSKLCCRLPRFC